MPSEPLPGKEPRCVSFNTKYDFLEVSLTSTKNVHQLTYIQKGDAYAGGTRASTNSTV
jgi:hypothetical protein